MSYREWDGGNLLRLFWRRRPHGFRGPDRCRRCGGVEFADHHPRGWWIVNPPLIERLP